MYHNAAHDLKERSKALGDANHDFLIHPKTCEHWAGE